MARRAAFLKSVEGNGQHRLVISGGDFFPPGGVEEREKGKTELRAIRAMNFDAIALGDFDFAHGVETLTEAVKGMPVVTTNIEWSDTHKPVGVPMLIKTYTGVPSLDAGKKVFKVAILSFMDERLQGSVDFYLEKDKRRIHILPAAEAAKEWLPKARAQANLVVALVHMNSTEATQFVQKTPGLDVVVCGHASEQVVDPPRKSGDTWIVANGDRGRFIGELGLTLDKDVHIVDATARQKPLDEKVGEDSTVLGYITDFKMSLAKERGEAPSGDAVNGVTNYATSQLCANCHRDIAVSWAKTDHARAYETLVKTHDQGREECLKCHVLGLGTPGGFAVNSPQKAMQGVQCENCHGGGVRHSMSRPEDKKATIIGHPKPTACMTCHNSERDPVFSFATKWAKIKH